MWYEFNNLFVFKVQVADVATICGPKTGRQAARRTDTHFTTETFLIGCWHGVTHVPSGQDAQH